VGLRWLLHRIGGLLALQVGPDLYQPLLQSAWGRRLRWSVWASVNAVAWNQCHGGEEERAGQGWRKVLPGAMELQEVVGGATALSLSAAKSLLLTSCLREGVAGVTQNWNVFTSWAGPLVGRVRARDELFRVG